MSLPTRSAHTHSVDARTAATLAAVRAALSLTWLLAGTACLALRVRDSAAGPLVVPAGIVLAACGMTQARLAWMAWRTGRFSPRHDPVAAAAFWRRLLIGMTVAYLAALAVGPARGLACAWLAAVAAWQTLLVLPLAAAPQALERWRSWTDRRTARRLSWLLCALIVALVAAEGGLRLHRAASANGWLASLGGASSGRNDGASEAPDVTRLSPARFRVAVLTDEPTSRQRDGYLARVEQSLPSVEIVNLPVSLAAAAYDGELAAHVEATRPDLVLAVLPVCRDLAQAVPETDHFDWRTLELVALVAGRPEPQTAAPAPVPAADLETFLHGMAPQIAACRTPIDETMHARWQRVFDALDGAAAACRAADVPLAVVIVPAEFQVDQALQATLLRRYGVSGEAFDVDLPQRRLAGFAQARDLPLIDLLPHLRLCREGAFVRHAPALNVAGNAAAATAIGGWLQSRYAGQLAAQLSKSR